MVYDGVDLTISLIVVLLLMGCYYFQGIVVLCTVLFLSHSHSEMHLLGASQTRLAGHTWNGEEGRPYHNCSLGHGGGALVLFV